MRTGEPELFSELPWFRVRQGRVQKAST